MVTNDPVTGVNTATGDDADTWILRYDKQGGTVLDLSPLPVGSTCQSPNLLFTGTQADCQAQITSLGLTNPAPAVPQAMCDAAQLKVLHAMLILSANAGLMTQQAADALWADAQAVGFTTAQLNAVDANCTAAGITAAQITDEVASLP